MPTQQRVTASTGGRAAPPPAWPESPQASRLTPSRWRDPRLWIGALLVVGSIVVGARVFAAADDTVGVWQLTSPLAAGSPIGAADVELTRVHFAAASAASSYLSADSPVPADATLTRDVAAGELLAASAVTTDSSAKLQQLPVEVTGAGVPSGLARGDSVDVWAVRESDKGTSARLVLTATTVVAVSEVGPGGLGADRGVTVALAPDVDVASALRALHGASAVLVLNGD